MVGGAFINFLRPVVGPGSWGQGRCAVKIDRKNYIGELLSLTHIRPKNVE